MQISDYQDSYADLKVNSYALHFIKKNLKFSIETLVEEIEFIFTLKNEIEYGDESIVLANNGTFGGSKIELVNKMSCFSTKYSCASSEVSIETLMKEMKLVNFVKKLESRDQWILLAQCGTFRLSEV